MAEGLLDASAMLGCVGGVSSSGVGGGGGGGGGGQKTKRLRTSFKHHQLRMLKSYFATNHNPTPRISNSSRRRPPSPSEFYRCGSKTQGQNGVDWSRNKNQQAATTTTPPPTTTTAATAAIRLTMLRHR